MLAAIVLNLVLSVLGCLRFPVLCSSDTVHNAVLDITASIHLTAFYISTLNFYSAMHAVGPMNVCEIKESMNADCKYCLNTFYRSLDAVE